jgi:hypothetical protein
LRCHLKCPLWHVGDLILLGKEALKVPALDLTRRITFEPLRSLVPMGDAAFRIQHVQGVIGYTVNEQFEVLIARSSCNLASPGAPECQRAQSHTENNGSDDKRGSRAASAHGSNLVCGTPDPGSETTAGARSIRPEGVLRRSILREYSADPVSARTQLCGRLDVPGSATGRP